MNEILKYMLFLFEQIKIPEGVRIPWFGGIWYSLISRAERILIKKIDIDNQQLNKLERERMVVVSLTTFPSRINSVYMAIKSLFLQTYKPDKIILWLAKEQFPQGVEDVNLLRLEKSGLEIRFCDDLKSHKKYFFAMQQEKESIIITYDDDLIYPRNSIELLMNMHMQYPECIVCNRGMEITYDKLGNIQPYSEWKVLSDVGVKCPTNLIMPSTGGGTLYPPSILGDEVFNLNNIRRLAWTADDLWMKAMELYYNIDVVKTRKYHKTFSVVEEQNEKLSEQNCGKGENDNTMLRLQNAYPNIFKRRENKE